MIVCKSAAEIEKMRRAARIVVQVLRETGGQARPGVTTLDLEKFVEKRVAELGAKPAFKGYRGYPCCLCASVNEQIIHGIPSTRRLQEGDILSLDLGVIVDRYIGDSALTVPIGEISESSKRLMRVTQEALELAIQKVRMGNRVGDISAAVEEYAVRNGYGVVREFVGHGVGRELHEEPQVPNYGRAGHGPLLKEGMVLAIEPMLTAGSPDLKVLDDQWTAVTLDGKFSAHFEHMVAVTRNGPDVLTRTEETGDRSQESE
jgi:methionyl aminopeptidase